MPTQPETLRLADELEDTTCLWSPSVNRARVDKAAAELRRLHVENKLLAGAADILRVAWRDEVHNLMKDKDQLQAHRDALLEALRGLLSYANVLEMRLLDADGEHRAMQQARAAIKAVEEGK